MYVTFAVFAIAAAEKTSLLSLTLWKSLYEITRSLRFSFSYPERTTTTRLGSDTPAGLNNSAFTALKIAELAPMASASVNMASAVNPGARHRERNANRVSRAMRLDHRNSALIAEFFLHLIDAAETTPRRFPRFARTHPPADVLLGGHPEVFLNLLVQILVQALLPEHRGEPHQPGPGIHEVLPRNRATRAVARSQFSTSI